MAVGVNALIVGTNPTGLGTYCSRMVTISIRFPTLS